ncbi:hypothetical protein FISHEDRAFT_79060 [Fistulina hepatica ATCC 64428]|uniref:Uncharacterized protein n=1 Tax=Fistulina hepatica ATCC 64428 TaxID=1128425 RepID=A0A0D7A0G7_9AGAR|nr:hypothetical protein FISHEDRAFT_79060 [Fistulina hepatica ATCC 64428]
MYSEDDVDINVSLALPEGYWHATVTALHSMMHLRHLNIQMSTEEQAQNSNFRPAAVYQTLHTRERHRPCFSNAFLVEVAPILVVTLSEFLTMKEPKPILLYSMCLVAAARRDVPRTCLTPSGTPSTRS